MKESIKQLIIIGGGTSIREGIEMGLWDKIKDKYVFGLNYSFYYFPNPTAQLWVDKDFYKKEKDKMAYMPLVIGKKHGQQALIANTKVFKTNSKYKRDLSEGIYKEILVGLFALSLGIYLLDEGEIFLLGFDYGSQGKDSKGRDNTHFYQEDITHRGTGKVNYYRGLFDGNPRADKDFAPYSKETKVKIYNVSLDSKINIFPKISYQEFFEKLNDNIYYQKELREEINKKLEKLK